MSVPLSSAPVPARRMLPIFQTLAHKVIDVGVAEVIEQGQAVSCKAGCGACCRQSVPISLTEARHIAEVVRAMPEPKQAQVRARFADAIARLDAAGMLEELRRFDEMPPEWHLTLNHRYIALRVPCPFLVDESCSIHPHRPIVCREYLVTSSPEHCVDTTPDVRRIPLHASVATEVARLEFHGSTASRVALVLALEWAEGHAEDEPAPRPPIEWLQQVLGQAEER
jgi:Fe-S-cluster containining protein